jgi:hypothetical protein
MSRFIFLIPLLLLATTASAQQQAREQGRDVCGRDASRFCRPHLDKGDQAVLACLKEHRGKLSKACERTLTEHGE